MKRRNFLKYLSTTAIPFTVNGFELRSLSKSLAGFSLKESDKVLVLIQLQGGNDGLNTIIPLESYDNLANARSNVIVPEQSILKVEDEYGFHPSIPEINDLFQDGYIHIVQGVAYPNQDRSHFRSEDIWTSGSSADTFLDSGWLGRYFETLAPDFPVNYPNDDFPHPFALTVGANVSETCQGVMSNFSLAINNVEDLLPLEDPNLSEFPDTKHGEALSFLTETIKQTNVYGEIIRDAASMGNSLSNQYDDNNELAQQLKTVAQLISGGLNTSVYVVTLGGFDTHADQVVEGETTTGKHAELLRTLSSAIGAFWDDLGLLGLRDKVMGMTFSEFGRQIMSNASYGTDHGTAAPMFVFGNCVAPGFSGLLPVIGDNLEHQEGTPMQFDFRSVYGNILNNWFEVDMDTTQEILNHTIQPIGIFGNCTTSVSEIPISDKSVRIFPNPSSHTVNVSLIENIESLDKIVFFDSRGAVVSNRVSILSQSGSTYQFDINRLTSGNYFLRVEYPYKSVVKKIIKF